MVIRPIHAYLLIIIMPTLTNFLINHSSLHILQLSARAADVALACITPFGIGCIMMLLARFYRWFNGRAKGQ